MHDWYGSLLACVITLHYVTLAHFAHCFSGLLFTGAAQHYTAATGCKVTRRTGQSWLAAIYLGYSSVIIVTFSTRLMSTQHVTALTDELKRDLMEGLTKDEVAVPFMQSIQLIIQQLLLITCSKLCSFMKQRNYIQRKQTALEVIMKIIISCSTRCIMDSGVWVGLYCLKFDH